MPFHPSNTVATTLNALALSDLLIHSFRFWPPPPGGGWQNTTFRTLFRLMVYDALIGSAAFLWTGENTFSHARLTTALVLLPTGFFIAFLATGQLGWPNAFGSKQGLRTQGIFACSRNPVYVATFLALVGWAILVPTSLIIATLAGWGTLYVVAVFLEERWLKQQYGADFTAYCQKVRRFF